VTFGGLMGGVIGFEEDIAFAPDFFGSGGRFGTNGVFTAMSNLIVSVPAGPARPYVTGGIGLVRTRLDLVGTSADSFSNNGLGYDIGGGLMVLLPHHLGVRGEIRYIRSFSGISILGFDVSGQNINFTRATIGLVIH
jgi:opacity protein-like surface antigen